MTAVASAAVVAATLSVSAVETPAVAAAPAVDADQPNPGGLHSVVKAGDGPATQKGAALPAATRTATLGAAASTSPDRAWTTAGDADGFHVLVADAASGYAWKTAATLAEPGVETDSWIGNACLTGSGRRAVVAYAPRTFTNDEKLFDRGAFTAVVDLTTGDVRKLSVRTSLAYFNPGCGAGETAVLTQAADADLGRTRLLELDAVSGTVGSRIEVTGQLTSPVPTAGGIVAADSGALVRVDEAGKRQVVAATHGVPFRVAADADGGVVFMEQSGTDDAAVLRVDAAAKPGKPATLASGRLTDVEVTSGRGGRVFVTGARRTSDVSRNVSLLDVPGGSQVSTHGGLVLTSVMRTAGADPRVPAANPEAAQPVTIAATAPATGKAMTFAAVPTSGAPIAGKTLTPALGSTRTPSGKEPAAAAAGKAGGQKAALAASPSDPSDAADRYCSVPRNDPRNQAMQPKPRQVEWAVDQAVRGALFTQRPANWKNLGMPAYTPQGLFPGKALSGGGAVPAQIMLGIAAQESNTWQAARFAVPGMTANPLIGNYYGLDIYNATDSDDWTINWSDADCGYGVTQVTDGMRLAGRTKPGETALSYDKQRAVALDFAANIAAGLQILQDKWNQTRAAGLTINDGTSWKLENWFFAVWAYNSGFYPESQAGQNNGAWGVGWANNPANPKYPATRSPFMDDTYQDAAHPQDWPYPEKIMGWAGHPVEVLEAPDTLVAAYRPAYWNGTDGGITVPGSGEYNRYRVKPPVPQFCNATNQCEPGAHYQPNAPDVNTEPAGPCAHKDAQGRYDLRCWYHVTNTWKPDCQQTCGNEILRFDPGYAYQDDGTAYPPACDRTGLPAGAIVADDVPSGTPSIRPNCPNTAWSNDGSFAMTWPLVGDTYPGKIDTHQLGIGFGGHLWMANARNTANLAEKLKVTGTWKFNTSYTGIGRIWVSLPPIGAGDALTQYDVKTRYGWRSVKVRQKNTGTGNRWVPIGPFSFAGQPEVQLTNYAPDGDSTQRVAFDAVAFEPITSPGPNVKVLHWNLAGAAKNSGDYDVADRLVYEITRTRPDVVTMNEICNNQFDHVRSRLEDEGYTMAGDFSNSKLTPTCFNLTDGRWNVGVGILVRGDIKGTSKYAFDGDNVLTKDYPVPDLDDRVVGCLTARITGTSKDTKVCTTHLAQKQDDQSPPWRVAELQARELARVFGPEAKAQPFILAGDLNIPTPPANDALSTLYAGSLGTGEFHEGFEEIACNTTVPCSVAQGGPATQGGGKIDYLFASRTNFLVAYAKSWINQDVGACEQGGEMKPCSDHYFSYAEFQMV